MDVPTREEVSHQHPLKQQANLDGESMFSEDLPQSVQNKHILKDFMQTSELEEKKETYWKEEISAEERLMLTDIMKKKLTPVENANVNEWLAEQIFKPPITAEQRAMVAEWRA